MATAGFPSTVMNGPPSSTVWASKSDWIRNQNLITQLYDQHTLAEVMGIMEKQHGFKATAKMYKTHIKQWGLDKKNKENEMTAIVRKNADRVSKGKASSFRIRGRPVDFAKVVRYWQRKGVTIDDMIAQQAASKTPEAVECSTPMYSPARTPEVLAIPEQIFLTLRDYHKGSFEAGNRVNDQPYRRRQTTKVQSDAQSMLNRMRSYSRIACELYHKHDPQGARQALVRATFPIGRIIEAEHPKSFTHIFDTVQDFLRFGWDEVAAVILRQVSDMARLILGERHPFKLVCAWLLSIIQTDRNRYDKTVEVSCGVIHDCSEEILGPLHKTTIQSKIQRLTWDFTLGKHHEQTVLDLEQLVGECEASLSPDDHLTLNMRLWLADTCVAQNNPVKAKEIAQALVAQTKSITYRIRGLGISARSHHLLDERAAAETNIREAIDLGTEIWGQGDGEVRLLMIDLEVWLIAWGNLESAAQVREERVRYQEPAEIL